LPQHEPGPDALVAVGPMRHTRPGGVPAARAGLGRRGAGARAAAGRPDRCDRRLAPSASGPERLRRVAAPAGRATPAVDGRRPDGGPEVRGPCLTPAAARPFRTGAFCGSAGTCAAGARGGGPMAVGEDRGADPRGRDGAAGPPGGTGEAPGNAGARPALPSRPR
jgi:hypothetical protein